MMTFANRKERNSKVRILQTVQYTQLQKPWLVRCVITKRRVRRRAGAVF